MVRQAVEISETSSPMLARAAADSATGSRGWMMISVSELSMNHGVWAPPVARRTRARTSFDCAGPAAGPRGWRPSAAVNGLFTPPPSSATAPGAVE